MKYMHIKISDPKMIAILKISGMPVILVTNPSKKPAIINIGTKPTIIFRPFFAPFLNDCSLEYVPGNNNPLPIIMPAAPAIIIAEISSVP